ncbi:hypothetical protein LPJ56_000162 [Coemansia sp. RSA 2599]|nr:hypothetical protein LPJ75_000030 [Coemansia sp. RSA 2598]KAJ1829643.1 hypothetical protein LPJ56_000162 [Coemansia sp. RSA 2599]
MENYHNYPPQYSPEQYGGQGAMHPSHMMYPHMGGMQMMGPMHGPAMVGPMMSYPAAMPNMSGGSKQPITRSTHVISEPACHVYRADEYAEAEEYSTRQLIAFDGKVFVEHIPGHNIIYAPISLKPQHVLQSTGSRVAKLRLKPKKMERPKNIFFKYRSHKVKELQIMYPKLNQTVISRIAAEHWKNEKPEVKEKYKKMYQDEMVQYELAKKIKRVKGSMYSESENEESEATESSPPFIDARQTEPRYSQLPASGPAMMASRPAAVDRTSPMEAQDNSGHFPPTEMKRQRSFTFPADARQQSDITNLIH